MKFKLSSLALALPCAILSSASSYASNTLPQWEGSQKVFSSVDKTVDPERLCQTFNSLTAQANKWLQDNNYPDSTVSQDLCTAVVVQTNYPSLYFYDIKDAASWDTFGYSEYWLDEQVDVTEEAGLILLSEVVGKTKRARYMLYNLAGADLVQQFGQYDYTQNIGPNHDHYWDYYGLHFTQDPNVANSDGQIMPTFWWRSGSSMSNILSSTWHNSSFQAFMIDRSNKELYNDVRSEAISFLRATGQATTEEAIEQVLPHFYYQTCSKTGITDPRCIPGGAENGNFIKVPYMFPESDSNGQYSHGTSSTVGVSIEAGGEVSGDGPTAGFNIGVSQEFTEEFSREGQIMTLDRSDLSGNFGGAWIYKIDPIGMRGIKEAAAIEETGYMEDRFTNANTVIGQEAWKTIDLSNQIDWQETMTEDNCRNGESREMWFINTYDLARTALNIYDYESGFSSVIETHEGGYYGNPRPITAISRGSIIKVDTICEKGLRIAKPGLLR
ncbi:hypothetical protein [Vibrio campbellii]|uniref:Uncharacterized protein n=1 Tax=Vibrio campbellii TaxID=680 RepID=A0ABY5I7J6_9VIBR|nr:hypothetical protein [Vibrio campbellii]UTZ22286.1 hypothetical protein HB760_10470 [Vibrio campbellii]UTZ30296.1 hypothetical protein HB762_02070 [Vibrio campbellii]